MASSIVQGKAFFLLQLAQFSLATLKKSDSQLDKILRLRRAPPSLGLQPCLHAPKDKGGLEMFSLYGCRAKAWV